MLVAGATGGVGQLVTAKLLEVREKVQQKGVERQKKTTFSFFVFAQPSFINLHQWKKTKKYISEATASEP